MRRTLFILLSALSLSIESLSLRSLPSVDLDACATVDCASGLICALAIPQSCNVSPCPKMPTCLPQNQTCSTNSCSSEETCVLRSVTCIKAPCYPVRECAKYPKCGVNEEYNECSLSSPCEPNCNDSFPICANNECGKGACECKAGFFRHNGTCITKDQCPAPTCEKPNEEWSTCPSACTRTCRIARGKDQEMMCAAMCGSPQCTCSAGYVRDDDWNCVKEEDCPKEFKCDSPHEEYKECSSHCEPTCENRSPTCIESCGPAKCQCKPSYVRHQGHCLFSLQCPLEGDISPLHPDRSGSEESEENSNENEGPSCASVRCGGNTTCSIKGGKTICAKCGKNERMESCPNPCSESSCDNDNSGRRCMVSKMCQPQRCVCSEGFVRNMKNGECIKKNKCPAGGNTTVHIQPIFINGTNPLTRPLFPLIDPINENGTMHIMPVFNNWTKPLIRPMFPPMNNETMHIMPHFGNVTIHGRPQVRPMFPDNNGTFHTMPYPSNDMHILPFFPANNGSWQAIPANENGTMHTMPHFLNGSIHGRPQVRPMFPDNNGTFHTMPIVENGTMHIMPHFENGTKHGRPQILPIFTGSNGTFNIMPISENGTLNILPDFGFGRPQVRPFFPPNNGSFHTMPFNENGTMHIRPFFPFKNGTKLTQPLENGTMNILPFIPSHNESGNGAIHILPYIPSNASNHNVCANHTCPEGDWCEETPVMCISDPCPPIPTCVSVSPRGGGARDQPLIEDQKCGKNEELSTCAPRCQPTCRGVNDCVEALMCTAGCVCKDKFKRDANGVCVPNHKCWKTAGCQENEIWHKCHGCEPTCSDSKEMCASHCESGCACDDGFVRGPKGDCIVQSKCTKTNSNSTRT